MYLLMKSLNLNPRQEKDYFEFIMKKIDDQNQGSDIFEQSFPFTWNYITGRIYKQITIPQIEDEEKVVAYINCKIVLFWSDYELFEEKKKKNENKLKKIAKI